MKVETYEAISLDVQGGEVVNEQVNEEALALIETLDLDGQRNLVQKRSVGDEEVFVRNPYRRMSKEEQAIFSALMPNRVKLERYADGPIPLRALQVAAHARSLDFFDRGFEVWCPQPGRDDPVLVGLKKGEYSSTDIYLLARWGEELRSLDELRAKASAIVIAKVRAAAAKAKAEVAAIESSLQERVDAYLHGGEESTVWVGISFSA